MAESTIINGYQFQNQADVKLAKEEIERIRYITGKMDMKNPTAVLTVYDKLVTSGIFVTPVGQEYLRTLQNYLFKSEAIDDSAIKEIPIGISYSDALNAKFEKREENLSVRSRTLRKTFRREYIISLLVNILLFIMVIAMFVITLKAETPNMINYRSAILNEYSEWQQELDEREKVIKEKELELIKNESK